ncbi:MAG: acyl-CoA thioesterase II [Pseudomonadales bacterium]|nr:acyl-CoA thioesterase II [Pseudomonadales bacterium]
MHERLAELIRLLDLEKIEENIFRGYHPAGRTHRLYGGQIMAQSLIAAGRTVDSDRPVHSLHGYFMRPGDPKVPVVFNVERIRDGRSFTTRRIVAVQHGKAIFSMDASFQVIEQGLEHSAGMPAMKPPTPEQVARLTNDDTFITYLEEYKAKLDEKPMPAKQHHWFITNGELQADDPLVHAALLTFQSDDALMSTSRMPHRGTFSRERMQGASLDHAMWFHQPGCRADQWILYQLDAPLASGARGYNRGLMFTADGQLVASTIQESLMRLR